MRRPAAGALMATLLVLLSGCASGSQEPDATAFSGQTNSPASQREALADGDVTFDEYRAGFDSFVACVKKAGYDIDEIGVGNDRLINYSIPGTAMDAGIAESCYEDHFRLLDIEWQIANRDFSDEADRTRACLTVMGETPKATLDEMDAQLAAMSLDRATMYERCPEVLIGG